MKRTQPSSQLREAQPGLDLQPRAGGGAGEAPLARANVTWYVCEVARGRLLAAALVVVSLGASCGGAAAAEAPTAKLIVEAMHLTWPDGKLVGSGGLNYPDDIYAVDVNGRHVRNLTHDDATNYLVGWLPTSRRIVYESVPSDRMRTGRSGIFSIKLDGSGLRQLASGKGELLPNLSPDRDRVLYAQGRWLYLMRADGHDKRRLVQTSFGDYRPPAWEPSDASWSPDGKRIAFVRGWSNESADATKVRAWAALYVINADGTGLHNLTPVRAKVEAMTPMWSPDGRKIVFAEHDFSHLDIHDGTYVIDADGTHKTRLPQLDRAERFWLPDGRIGYYGGPGLRAIDADGKGKPEALPARVRIGANEIVAKSALHDVGQWPVSPDGNWIVTTGGVDNRSIWIEHLDGTQRRLVTRKICCIVWTWAFAWAG